MRSLTLVKGAYSNFKLGQLTAFKEFFYVESDRPEDRQNVQVGNLTFAGEHLSDEFYGYMDGAAQTGRLAALAVLKKIKKPSRSAIFSTKCRFTLYLQLTMELRGKHGFV